MTSPIIRKLFMAPRNELGVRNAVTSLLAGQVFETTGPVQPRLWFFRIVYYAHCVRSLPTALRAWRNRKRAVRAVA